MRRHPLGGPRGRLLGGILLAPLLVGCVAPNPVTTASPQVALGVTISTAPGETLAFDPVETTVRGVGTVSMTFRNGSSLAHNLVFTAGLNAATRTIVEPGTSDHVSLVLPGAGAYPFVCTIHAGMAGVLLVVAPDPGRADAS